MKPITHLLVIACLCAASIQSRAQTAAAGKVDLTFTQTNSFGSRPNAPIVAIGVQTNGQVLIGGTITQPLNSYGIARLNVNGMPDNSFTAYVKRNNTLGFPGLSGTVRKIMRRPDGGFYINGIFHAVANVAGYTHLAALDANGNHDTNFVPSGLDVELLQAAKLTVQNDNKVLVNINSNVVHRLSHAGAVEVSMVLTNVVTVHSLTADPNGGFYVAGASPDEIPVRVRVFRFDAAGVLDTNFNAPLFDSTGGNPAYTLELPLAQPNGKVLVLGNYISAGGVQRGGLCRLNLDGTLDTSFVPGANGVGTIYQGSLIGLDGITRLPDGRFIIYRNGPFRYDSIYRNGVARISSGGALDTAFDPGKGPQGDNFGFVGEGVGMQIAAPAADGNIYAGGFFTNFNNTGRQYIVRLNAGPASTKPTIDTHPVSQSVTNGVDVTFTVLATGPGTLSYVWKRNNVTIPGATAASLTVTNVELGDVGAYVVTVANSAGSVVALPAILTVNGVSTPDLTGPNFKVTSPAGTFVLVTTNQFDFRGTAADNQGLGVLLYKQDTNPWTQIGLTTNWAFTVTVNPGTNVFLITVGDTSGNFAVTQRFTAFYSVPRPLGLNVVGNGKINGGTNGQPLEIGKSIALTVTPGTGWILTNWLVQVDGNPTITTNKAVPFLMASNTVVTATFADIAKPALTVTAPTANQRWSNAVFTVAGKVTDNNTNGSVWYQLNGGAWTNANGWTNWNATINLTPGTNNLKAFALDAAGNRSTTNSVNFVRVLTAPFCLSIIGNGKVTGATNSQPIELGRNYLLTTTPGTGWILTNWLVQIEGNTVVSTNKSVAFLMQSNLCVTATFADTAKPALTVIAPTANQRWSNAVFTVAGKVTDNNTNGSVWYQLNGGTWTNANGWTNWSASVNLTPGTNNLKAFALDAAGNRSTTNSVNFVYVFLYCLAEYYHPTGQDSRFIYDGLDWDGNAAQLQVVITDTNYPLLTYSGTAPVTNYIANVIRADSAYGFYDTNTDQFTSYDDWQDYYVSGLCSFGFFGSDDDGESFRVDRAAIFTNGLAVGQTVSLTRNLYTNGAFAGPGTIKLQLLDVSTVTVPAGTFPGCLRIRMTFTAGKNNQAHDDWLAPGVGMVKQQGVSGDGAAERWELIRWQLPGSSRMAKAVTTAPPATPPALQLLPTADGGYSLKLSGQLGAAYVIESSTDGLEKSSWNPIWSGALEASSVEIPINTSAPAGFYRARQE